MAELIAEVFKKTLISFLLVISAGFIFNDLFRVGENALQSTAVLSFYIFCGITLFTSSRYKLFYVLSIPVLTQFVHIFQKYTFAAGANSIWRLLPFLLLDLYFMNFLIRKSNSLSSKARLFIICWLIFHGFFLAISVNFERVIWGGIVLYLITLPLFFSYLSLAIRAYDFRSELEKYLSLLFIILGLGTFGLVYVGAGYKGSDNLLVTRNIADTNVTMAYFILLWPFVILYSSQKRGEEWFKPVMLIIFTGVVILSFSRGAVLIIGPYLAVTVLLTRNFLSLRWIIPILGFTFVYRYDLAGMISNLDLAYFWKLRFGDLSSIHAVLDTLERVSGRSAIHQTAYILFLQKPLTGHGIASFEILGPGYREAHSLWYTLLAEEGIIGILFHYGIFVALGYYLLERNIQRHKRNSALLAGFSFYLLFNHTVGSVFVILPGKSITVNCIAPILLMCLYFHAKSGDYLKSNEQNVEKPEVNSGVIEN